MLENLEKFQSFLKELEGKEYSPEQAKRPALYSEYLTQTAEKAFNEIAVKGNDFDIENVMTATEYDSYNLNVAMDILSVIKKQSPNLF